MFLETERLQLRHMQIQDAVEVFQYRSDAFTNKFQSWIPGTIQEVEDFISRNTKEFNKPESWYQVVIIQKATNSVIGDIGVHFFGSENLQVELGCTLSKKYQGKGYASEALRAVVAHLFREQNKHRIMASIDPENIPSIQLFERIGFRKEGCFKESLFIKGIWVDDLIYAILNREWQSTQAECSPKTNA